MSLDWVTISMLVFALMLWALVGLVVAAWWIDRPPDQDGPEDDDDGGSSVSNDPDGPTPDWGAWWELETKEHGFEHVHR